MLLPRGRFALTFSTRGWMSLKNAPEIAAIHAAINVYYRHHIIV